MTENPFLKRIGGKVQIDPQELEDICGALPRLVARAAERYINEAFESIEPWTLNFATLLSSSHGSSRTEDPLTMVLCIPIEDQNATWPEFHFNIRDLICGFLELEGPSERTKHKVREIVFAMRALADELDVVAA